MQFFGFVTRFAHTLVRAVLRRMRLLGDHFLLLCMGTISVHVQLVRVQPFGRGLIMHVGRRDHRVVRQPRVAVHANV